MQKNKAATSPGYYWGMLAFKFFRFAFMALMTFVVLYPVIYMISMSFRTVEDVYDLTVVWIPKHLSVNSFTLLYHDLGIVKPLLNTAWISISSAVLQTCAAAITGYGFARFKFPFRGLLFLLLVFSIVVPPQMIAMPTYLMFSSFDIFGIFTALNGAPISLLGKPGLFPFMAILGSGIRASLFILIMRQFYTGMPKELEDAAHIDGCGHYRCYWHIMLPASVTQMIMVFLFSIVWYWNDYYFASIYLGGASTFSVKLSSIRAALETSETLGQLSHNSYQIAIYEQAGCLLLIAPLIILYLCLQRHFVESIEKSGIVG
ncbi:MAG: carbohydrate ABC transporter permease [Clostridiales bacterium]|nr:carbohydrate ABC transporter permease [Clostridiales bacterium]